jgi:hypothetical protein
MTEEGALSIVRRGNTYQVRYASYNPYASDRLPHACADMGTLSTFLHQCGTDPWYIMQAMAELRKRGFAVVPHVCSDAQLQGCFPLPPVHPTSAETPVAPSVRATMAHNPLTRGHHHDRAAYPCSYRF